MSTRGNICVKVRESDFEKVNEVIKAYNKEVTLDTPFLFIYNHHDSYPTGLGKELMKKYYDYNSALTLVLQGDCSWPGSPYTDRGEEYSYNCPRVTDDYTKANQQEYLYVYKDNTWSGYDWNMAELKL